ncbi:CRAL-TRIO domain-containing protein [Phlyctochytrium arcticum]|nr:CRAL-TRIO domain-containing protein [Phlyctochytrium arcticum]
MSVQDGYVGHLTPEQQTSLSELVTTVKPELEKLEGFDDEDKTLWRVPFYNLKKDELTIGQCRLLLKYLRARTFNVAEAATSLIETIKWRKEFNIKSLMTEETFPEALMALGTIHGVDKNKCPVTYNFYGTMSQDEVAGHPDQFLRWRIQLHERAIALLDFNDPSSSVETITQVHNYSDVGLSIDKRLKATSKEIIGIFQKHYPEFLQKKFFLGVPVYLEFLYGVFSSFVNKATRDKFVIVAKNKIRSSLLEVIDADQILPSLGGFSGSQPGSLQDVSQEEKRVEIQGITTVTIPARKQEVVRIPIPSGISQVHYVYMTYALDIGFTASIEHADETTSTVPPLEETKTEQGSGQLPVPPKTTTLVMTFNNTYSYLTEKKVVYRVHGERGAL